MKEIITEITIDANISTVWNVLMDFENHPKWNPFIKSISGEKIVGKKLEVFIKPPDGNGMTFKPVILKLDVNKEFRWKGKLGIPGLFDGEHFFILEPIEGNKTKFVHGEKFSGLLIPLLGKIFDKTVIGFDQMNKALKSKCEE